MWICSFVSLNKKSIINTSIKLKPAINQYGIIAQKCSKIAQNNGPKIKPQPKIAQIIHIFFALSSLFFDISEIIDCKILIFHPVIQLTALAIKNTKYIGNIGTIKEDIKDQITQSKSIFFLQ